MSPELNREEFETWCSSLRRPPQAVWHPKYNRYTILSEKQNLFECWNAARGLEYKWFHFITDEVPNESGGVLYG